MLHSVVTTCTTHQHSVSRIVNSAQSCDDGIVAITAAALPRWTSIAIFCVKNWHTLLSPICSMTQIPICCIIEWTQDPHAPKSQHKEGKKWKLMVRVEYFLTLADSVEFPNLPAILWDTATITPKKQTTCSKNINISTINTSVFNNNGAPRCKLRAIFRDSLSGLVPKEGTRRAPSQPIDSEEATNNKRAFTLESVP